MFAHRRGGEDVARPARARGRPAPDSNSTRAGEHDMSQVGPSAATERRPLGIASTLLRLALIGGALLVVVGGFAYLGGWLTPAALTPGRFTDAFQQVNGVQPGFRRNHAKGIGVSGFFESNGNGRRVSKAVVFQPGRVPVLGRFSLSGGQPYAADVASDIRGLGLQF